MRTSDTQITEPMRDAWFDIAQHLARPLFLPGGAAYARRDRARLFWDVAAEMEGLLPRGCAWSDAGAAKVANHWYRVGPHREGGVETKYVERTLGIVRCLAMAHAVASREPGRLGLFDARHVHRALEDMPGYGDERRVLLERCLYGNVMTAGMAEVAFRMPTFQPGPDGRLDTARVARGKVALARVSPGDAPVVARLRTPLEPLAVRSLGEGFIRPLLEPGSWRPLREGDLGEALSGMSAWRDDPFRDFDEASNDRLLPTDDLVACDAGTRRRRRDAPDEAALAAGALGALVIVDDVVHRRTRTPRTVLVCLPAADGAGMRYTACWTTGDLGAWQDQDVAVPRQGRHVGPTLLGGVTMPLLSPELHDRVVSAWRGEGSPAYGVSSTVEWVDPDAFGLDPDALRQGMLAGTDGAVPMARDDNPAGPGRWPGGEVRFPRVGQARADLPGEGYVRAYAAVAAEIAVERDEELGAIGDFAP